MNRMDILRLLEIYVFSSVFHYFSRNLVCDSKFGQLFINIRFAKSLISAEKKKNIYLSFSSCMAQHYCHQPRMLVQKRVFSHFQSDVFSRIRVRALILSPLSRVMGNVYVFSRIKETDSSDGCLLVVFSRT